MAAPPPYNPAGFVLANPATWPPPIPPATLYQPGMAWTMTGPGVVDGQTVKAGDLLFVVHRDRLYGDFSYGDGMYGSTPDQDWTAADVRFVAWYSSAPPADQPPFPYSGCKFGDTGWWVIVDAFYVDAGDARHYGEQNYGDGTYGGGSNAVAHWVDITAGFTEIQITRGSADGDAKVDVCEIDIAWYDPMFARVDLALPEMYSRPFVGAPIRVSFYDPQWRWHPRAVGSIEQIIDPTIWQPTSGEVRYVTMQAFGHVTDLSRTLLRWQRPQEPASVRFAALLTAGGWRYSTGALVYPTDVMLHADRDPRDVTAIDEIDRTAMSAGWTFDTDRRGNPRLRVWPLPLVDPPTATVADCAETPGLTATLVTFTADESQLLNIVSATNDLAVPTVCQSTDPTSIDVYGGRDNSLGFPATGLAFLAAADGQALVERVRARYSRIITHAEPLEGDTLVDLRWLDLLADIDTGEHLTVTRTHPEPFTLDAIVVGVEERIGPDRIVATLFTTTTTPTN